MSFLFFQFEVDFIKENFIIVFSISIKSNWNAKKFNFSVWAFYFSHSLMFSKLQFSDIFEILKSQCSKYICPVDGAFSEIDFNISEFIQNAQVEVEFFYKA